MGRGWGLLIDFSVSGTLSTVAVETHCRVTVSVETHSRVTVSVETHSRVTVSVETHSRETVLVALAALGV